MDIWHTPIGEPVELGRARAAGVREVVGLIEARVPLDPGVRLESLHWCPPTETPGEAADGGDLPDDRGATGGGTALRVAVIDRSASGRAATLRVYRANGDGRLAMLADLRYRRGPARDHAGDGLLHTPVQPGSRCTRRFVVGAAMTTDHVPGAQPLLSTPMLIGLMEDTAADVLRPRFAGHTASVGTWIGVRHTGPAHGGDRVEVTAIVADVRGRQVIFDVWANVDGRPIGDGQVTQTLIRVG